MATPCKIELRASGHHDKQPRGNGFVKLNGHEVTPDKGRGFTLVTITPSCRVTKITQYDTYASTNAAAAMRAYLLALPKNTVVVGITDDTYMRSLASAKPVLVNLGVDLTASAKRTSLGFVLIKGQPANTVQKVAAHRKGPALLCVKMLKKVSSKKINALMH